MDQAEVEEEDMWYPTLGLQADAVGCSILPPADQVEEQLEAATIKTLETLSAWKLVQTQQHNNTEFWDDRKAKEWQTRLGAVRSDRFTIVKSAVNALKKTTLAFTNLQVDDQFEREVVTKAYQSIESVIGEVLIPREGRQKKFPPGPKKVLKAFEKVNQLPKIYNDKKLCDMWDTNNKAPQDKFATVPFYARDHAILEVVQRRTAQFSKMRHFLATESPTKPLTDQERRLDDPNPKPPFEPPMSPPLVPRPAPIFIDLPQLGLGQTAGLLNDLQQADAARAIPTSPSGAHTLNDRFNQLEGILPIASSSSRPSSPARAHPLWSSDGVGASFPARSAGDYERLESPVFGRTTTSASIPALEDVLRPRSQNNSHQSQQTKCTQYDDHNDPTNHTDPAEPDTFATQDKAFIADVQPIAYADYQTSDPHPPDDMDQLSLSFLGTYRYVTWPEVPPPVDYDLPTAKWIGLKGLEIQLRWTPWSEPKPDSVEGIAAGKDDLNQFHKAKEVRDWLRAAINEGLSEVVELVTEVEKADAPLVVWPELVDEEGDRNLLTARIRGFVNSPTPSGTAARYSHDVNSYGKRPLSPSTSARHPSAPPSKLVSPRLAVSFDLASDEPTSTPSAEYMNYPAAENDVDGQNEVPPVPSGLLDPLSEQTWDDEIEIVEEGSWPAVGQAGAVVDEGATVDEPARRATENTTESTEQRAGGEVLVIKLGYDSNARRAVGFDPSSQANDVNDYDEDMQILDPSLSSSTAPPRPPTPPVLSSTHTASHFVQTSPRSPPPPHSTDPNAARDVDALLAAKLKSVRGVPTGPSSALASHLDLKKAHVAVEKPVSFASRIRIKRNDEAAAAKDNAAAGPPPEPRPHERPAPAAEGPVTEPPYDQLTLPRPRFEVDLVETSAELSKVYRIVASAEFMQLRATTRAVREQPGLHLLERRMRWGGRKGKQLEPHLIADGVSCIIFRQMATVAGNAVPRAGAPVVPGRPEAWSETLWRMAAGYDRVLLVAIQSIGKGVPAMWTPPNVKALNELAKEIEAIEKEHEGCRVEVAFPAGEAEVGEMVKGYVEWLESEARKEAEQVRNTTGMMFGGDEAEMWGRRGWLVDEQGEAERQFLESTDLNAVSASALAGLIAFEDFIYRLTKEERRRRFGRVVGMARIDRISDSITVQAAGNKAPASEADDPVPIILRTSSSPAPPTCSDMASDWQDAGLPGPTSDAASGGEATGEWDEVPQMYQHPDDAYSSEMAALNQEAEKLDRSLAKLMRRRERLRAEGGRERDLWELDGEIGELQGEIGELQGERGELEGERGWRVMERAMEGVEFEDEGVFGVDAGRVKRVRDGGSFVSQQGWTGYDDGHGGKMRWDDRGEMYRGQ